LNTVNLCFSLNEWPSFTTPPPPPPKKNKQNYRSVYLDFWIANEKTKDSAPNHSKQIHLTMSNVILIQ
jgi:hypothetical protein